MTILATDKQKDALKHLLENVLGLPEDTGIWKALANFAGGVDQLDIYMVVRMDYNDIRDLTYKTSVKAASSPVPKGISAWLINFQKMHWEYEKAGKIMVGKLLTLTTEEFEKYEHDLRRKQVMDPSFHTASPPPTSGRPPSDPIQDFNKGVQ